MIKQLLPMLLSSKAKLAGIGAIVILVVTYVGYSQARIVFLKNSLEKAELREEVLTAKLDTHKISINSLIGSVDRQNEQVNRLLEMTERRQVMMERVESQIIQSRRVTRQAISDLKVEEGESCQEGVRLIDRELRL